MFEYLKSEIKQLFFPILEAIRNILTNQILQNTSIQLDPKPLSHHTAICYSCDTKSNQYKTFWIIDHSLSYYKFFDVIFDYILVLKPNSYAFV